MECQCEGDALSEECITNILSRTTPLDACRLSLISKTFCSAAESDIVWGRFLPSDLVSIISGSDSHSSLLANSPSKKSLYFTLSENPIIIDHATKSFQLDKKSGKKCYMFAARSLNIAWSNYPQNWNWKNLPESRFPEVAELIHVDWLDIHGAINTYLLSPKTSYSAYLVFKLLDAGVFYRGLMSVSITITNSIPPFPKLGPPHLQITWLLEHGIPERVPTRFVEIVGDIVGDQSSTNGDCLDLNLVERQADYILVGSNPFPQYPVQRSHVRSDGWLEIEIGEFYVSGILDSEVKMSLMDVMDGNSMRGLIIEGIEVRPKEQN